MNKLHTTLILLLTTFTLWGQNVKFSAGAPSAVIAGEKFQLVYSVNTEATDLRLPQIDNFQILMGPSTSQSSSMTIINGNVERSSQYAFTYILKASIPGKYTIGAASIVVNGKRYESNSLQIEVIKGEDAATRQNQESTATSSGISNEDLFLTTSVNKSDPYKDEPILVTTKIYVRSINLQGISDVQNPDLKDFISQELPRNANIDWTIETVNGKTYNVGIYEQKLLYPQKSGSLKIEPTEVEFLIKQRVTRQSQSVFDDFFESNSRTVKKRVASKAITINAKALPSPTPADFSGVVGNIELKTSVTSNKVKTNEAVTIKLEVSGTGNHKLMADPKITIPSDFEQYDPKITNNITNTAGGMTGTKTYEFLIIPRHSGEYTIPAITLSFFNIKEKRFQQLSSNEIKLSVEKGLAEESGSSTPQFATSREDLKFIGKDIRFIKTDDKQKLKARNSFLLGSGLLYVLLLLPLILFGTFIYFAKKLIHQSQNISLIRNKKATKIALKRLKKAALLLKENKKEAFYDEVLRSLWDYMSDKLSLPVSKLSKDNASDLMSNRNVSTETIKSFMDILDTCEFARYSPSSGNSEMDKLYHQTIDAITSIESEIKK